MKTLTVKSNLKIEGPAGYFYIRNSQSDLLIEYTGTGFPRIPFKYLWLIRKKLALSKVFSNTIVFSFNHKKIIHLEGGKLKIYKYRFVINNILKSLF